MQQGLNCVLMVCASALCTLVGIGLFRLGRAQIAAAPPQPDAPERPLPERVPAKWIAGMAVGNVAVALVLTLYYQGEPLAVLRMLMLCTLLWSCAWTDWQALLIPNRILLAGLAGMALFSALKILSDPGGAGEFLLQAFVPAGALFLAGLLCRVVVPNSVGFGDLKLFGVMGMYLGYELIWGAVLFSLVAAFVYSLALLVTKRATRKSVIPFAPFLLIGTLLAAFLNGI